jgi:hypothetical protein
MFEATATARAVTTEGYRNVIVSGFGRSPGAARAAARKALNVRAEAFGRSFRRYLDVNVEV